MLATKKSRRLLQRIWGSSVIALTILAIAGSAPPASAKTTIKLGHLQAPANHQHLASTRFAELVAQKTNGQHEVKLFPAAQLGSRLRDQR